MPHETRGKAKLIQICRAGGGSGQRQRTWRTVPDVEGPDLVRKRLVVAGEVQGVFYRDTCRRRALAAGVAGWVRNLPDQRVEVVFEGEPEPVRRLVAWAQEGPREAVVAHVDVRDEPPEGLSGFTIRTTPYR
jgi:acylphosphatase